ncbi:MAG: PEP-CTERM sorting domain-containing protein [Terriglobales bacterium]
MKQYLLPLSVLCVTLVSSTAFADHIYLSPGTDNFGFVGEMNGHQFFLSGGTPSDFFNANGYAPGSMLGGGTTLFLNPAEVWINGVATEFVFPPTDAGLGMSSITLPTDGRSTYTVPVQIGFSAAGINVETGQTIQLGADASGWITFDRGFDSELYYPSAFVQAPVAQVPEPCTLGLIGTGIIGIMASARKRLKRT